VGGGLPYLIDTNIAIHARAAHAYGGIIAQCGWARGWDFDRMIADHALSTGAVLVTDN
jgi:tRNA(fMet)-specific endonuclease VapC